MHKNFHNQDQYAEFLDNLVKERQQMKITDFFMDFEERHESEEKMMRVKLLWKRLAELIIGSDSDYNALKQILARFKFQFILDKFDLYRIEAEEARRREIEYRLAKEKLQRKI